MSIQPGDLVRIGLGEDVLYRLGMSDEYGIVLELDKTTVPSRVSVLFPSEVVTLYEDQVQLAPHTYRHGEEKKDSKT